MTRELVIPQPYIIEEKQLVIKNRVSGVEEVFDIDNMSDEEIDKLVEERLKRFQGMRKTKKQEIVKVFSNKAVAWKHVKSLTGWENSKTLLPPPFGF